MRWRGPLLQVGIAALGVAALGCAGGCAAGESSATRDVRAAAQPWEVDAYTRMREIIVDGTPVGYLVTYDAIPAGEPLERALPAGSHRIQDLRFVDVGFISPRGALFRHAGDGALALGHHPLEAGLLRFFGGGQRVRLAPFAPAPRVPLPTELAPGEGGEDAGEDSGDGSGEDEES